MRLRRGATVFLVVILVLGLTVVAYADYTTDKGYTVQWTNGDNIVVRNGQGDTIYNGPGKENSDGRLVPPSHVKVGSPPPNRQNTTNIHSQTINEGYTVWDGDVPIKNNLGDVVGWATLFTNPSTKMSKGIVNDPVTGHATGDWTRNEYDHAIWVPSGNGYGGWVCVGCEIPSRSSSYTPPPGTSGGPPPFVAPPPPPPPPPIHIGDTIPSTGQAAKRGQDVTLQINTSGPVNRVEVDLPPQFKNISVRYGDQTELVSNSHTAATAAGGNRWSYRFILAWTQSQPPDGTYQITVRAYGDEGQTDTKQISFTVQGMVGIYSPGG